MVLKVYEIYVFSINNNKKHSYIQNVKLLKLNSSILQQLNDSMKKESPW